MKKILSTLLLLALFYGNQADAALSPSPQSAFNDIPVSYKDGCHANVNQARVKVCKYGDTIEFNYTVAIIGDSHAGHWLGALQAFAKKYDIRIVYATKSGCSMTSQYMPKYPSCNEWNKNLIPTIARYHPDLVLTKADYSLASVKTVPSGFIDKFNELKKRNIEVFAIRDTPRFAVNIPACVSKYGADSIKCKTKAMPKPSNWSKLKTKPTNVHYFDYTFRQCDNTYCHPVKNNIITVRDQHHMTNTYSQTFRTYILKDMMPILREVRARKLASTK
ncbi:SGNH hydrolase domain-containing protein [Macrococcus bovicus]|uniref:SGNH hydrolase domain-containing protein n=1 Tax=Macrococcus bovicus TaxID=69968 RepID=UPI0025A569E2|nr:SGNH hydrolase domain-containing protein [Macrococcus bovicus]WJP98174.1 SGNH hydrolase domain-containing protein [Macrococcus bovicus]